MLYAFLMSKGALNIDLSNCIRGLCVLVPDKNIKVRFIALEALAYISTLEKASIILQIANNEVALCSKHAVSVLRKRIELGPRIKLTNEQEVEYP